ncbi:hypothetical protein JOE57_002311 [Microlunatus panaciterrae]|uniref:Abortive infection C-terminus n=1 Tax=Microlunatus panaciterrae TaxID=400768 RepID=A0ABS2RK53_9ACTN|nr:ANTAR domain-containing protein [Microlunatus panaciterrae]MBM7799390.1 hypothetical protein [Microlunatus panaciterrae]
MATSLRLDLHELTGAEPPSRICLYAAVPGAFVDLAADIRHALRLTDGSIGLDETKTPTSLTSGLNGLAELSAINQAIGILIGRGHPPGHAHRELSRQADGAGVSLHVRARQLIYETSSILRSSALPDDPPDGQRN